MVLTAVERICELPESEGESFDHTPPLPLHAPHLNLTEPLQLLHCFAVVPQ